MPREIANQSIKSAAAQPNGAPNEISDRLTSPPHFISSAGLVKALTQPATLVILWTGVFAHFWNLFDTLGNRVHRWDFSLYYLGSYAQSHGLNPYTTNLAQLAHRLGLQPGLGTDNFDPPSMVIAMEPLTWMSVTAAYWTWFAINVFALVVVLYLLIGPPLSSNRRFASAFLALVLLYPPLGIHFYYAQTQVVALLLLVLTMRSMERDRQPAVGLTFGLLSVLRTYPMTLGCYFLIRRNWRGLIFAVLAALIFLSLTIFFAGVEPWRSFFKQVNVPTMDDYSNGPANVALSHTVLRLLTLVIGEGATFPVQLARLVAVVVTNLAIVMLSVKLTAESWELPDEDWRVYSLWVVTMLLVSPLTWVHSLILLILPFAQLTIAGVEGRASRRAMWMGVVSYAMITIAFGWHRLLGTYDTYQLSSSVAELGPLSLIAAYVSVYWFSVDRDFPSAESSVAAAGTTRHATTSPLLPHPKPVSLGIAAI